MALRGQSINKGQTMQQVSLTKATGRTWNGTGFGYSGAVWYVKNHPNIRVSSVAGAWIARDTDSGKIVAGICSNRASLIQELSSVLV
jgi:hypothetical protein